MVKYIFICSLLFNFLYSDVYETNCLHCHNKLPVSIDKYFYRYLLKYSSERAVKKAMKDYLLNPTKENTIMPEAFIKRFGVKKKTTLSEKKLTEAIDKYWEEYKVFGKLK
ncbi:hypothetical protein CRV08_00405 [Halarcobacter ebronensis]|uniref:Cytochrome c domain-containing protein n=1 Tax=Halarcobacter ebronensis TaxID=1462615 RepID=A0A4Q0YLC6_9BACT|nr:hypothetical protein [Halarcobacter ebronensis]RXJ70059.1 hypothetical protein CRV08_00405 [Halarcobacter ebronensis]